MLSINNRKEQQRQMTTNPNRFSLRKLSVGVCSLVVGFSFMGMMAHADQVSPSEATANQEVVQTTNNEKYDQQQSTNPQTTDQNVNKNQTTTPVLNNDKATDNAAAKNPVKPADQSVTTSANKSSDNQSTYEVDTSYRNINRVLKRLADLDVIKIDHATIKITDCQTLRKIVETED